jgi:hypothetical protein
MRTLGRCAAYLLLALTPGFLASSISAQQSQPATASTKTTVADLRVALGAKAKELENSSGMRQGFQSFLAAHHLAAESLRYSDYVLVRLYYEATRDAGLWNLRWAVTDKPPNSDNIWRQWQGVSRPSASLPTATAECDELSALFAFMAERSGVKSVGLFWPYANHTVAVWIVHPTNGPALRVVVPTTQIFLEPTDYFDTAKFNPWKQKTIYEYTRRDVPDTFVLQPKLFEFFVQKVQKYAGASDTTLQQLRYLREAVLQRVSSPQQAAQAALNMRAKLSKLSPDDRAAFDQFVRDMRSDVPAF